MKASSVLLVRGVLAIGAGLLSMLWPGLTIAFLVALFGVYVFLDGVTNVARALTPTPERERSWSQLFQGLFGIAAGVVAFVWPASTAFVLLIWIALWAIVTGAFEIAAAIRLRRVVPNEWRLALMGGVSIIFGLMLAALPSLGAIGLAWALGAYAMAIGILFVTLAIRLKTTDRALA